MDQTLYQARADHAGRISYRLFDGLLYLPCPQSNTCERGRVSCAACGGDCVTRCEVCAGDEGCLRCRGSGEVSCATCKGRGDLPCEACAGRGVIPLPEGCVLGPAIIKDELERRLAQHSLDERQGLRVELLIESAVYVFRCSSCAPAGWRASGLCAERFTFTPRDFARAVALIEREAERRG